MKHQFSHKCVALFSLVSCTVPGPPHNFLPRAVHDISVLALMESHCGSELFTIFSNLVLDDHMQHRRLHALHALNACPAPFYWWILHIHPSLPFTAYVFAQAPPVFDILPGQIPLCLCCSLSKCTSAGTHSRTISNSCNYTLGVRAGACFKPGKEKASTIGLVIRQLLSTAKEAQISLQAGLSKLRAMCCWHIRKL